MNQTCLKLTAYFGERQRAVDDSARFLADEMLDLFGTRDVATSVMLRGIASFNVLPEQSAAYFNKVQCFCFTDQELRPGEVAEFPVSFYIDPQITADKDARDTRNITLSYTFHPLATPKAGVTAEPSVPAPSARSAGAGSG